MIATVFNEAASIEAWLSSLAAQTRAPDEVVIVDAGSRDGTIERLRARALADPRLHVHVVEGANVPQGRNEAIRLATGDVVAITDAGTTLDPAWLEHLVRPLYDPAVDVSAGFFAPDGASTFERVLAAVITPRLPEIDPATFLPSSRSVALRRDWCARVGGYPGWLRAGEDLVFSMRLRAAGARVAFAPDALVRWRPRPSLAGFYRQYRHYARGDGHAHLWTKRHVARYAAYGAGTAMALAGRRRRAWWGLLAAGFGGYLRKFCWRVRAEQPAPGPARMALAYALVPLIVVTGDVAKMGGYPLGLWERLRAGSPEALETLPIRSHRASGD